jgi:transposase
LLFPISFAKFPCRLKPTGEFRLRTAVLALQRVHACVRNQRHDFHHKVSQRIVRDYGAIFIEKL